MIHTVESMLLCIFCDPCHEWQTHPLKVNYDEIGSNSASLVLDIMYLLQFLFQHQSYELISYSLKDIKASLAQKFRYKWNLRWSR